ncbi:MAG: repeat domain in Vibrio, Colwellia, Bradyrhizobium and Shewanella [Bacteroidota bacterium]|nr:repeat domain in Vibrio, Colwellia, Bradyrhizobium and Shewanella [Bacteroidota bacterium]
MKKSVYIFLVCIITFSSSLFAQKRINATACEGSTGEDYFAPIYTRDNMFARIRSGRPDLQTHYSFYNRTDSSWYYAAWAGDIAGSIHQFGVWLFKCDKKNNLQQKILLPASDSAYNVVMDSTGIYLFGNTYGTCDSGLHILFKLSKYNFFGALQWYHPICTSHMYGYISGIDNNGNICLLLERSPSFGIASFQIIRMNSGGAEIYNNEINEDSTKPVKIEGNYLYAYGNLNQYLPTAKTLFKKINLLTGNIDAQKVLDSFSVGTIQPLSSGLWLMGWNYATDTGKIQTLDDNLNLVEQHPFAGNFDGGNYYEFDTIENYFYLNSYDGYFFTKVDLSGNIVWQQFLTYVTQPESETVFHSSNGNLVRYVNDAYFSPATNILFDVLDKNTGQVLYAYYNSPQQPDSMVYNGHTYYLMGETARQSRSNPDILYLLKTFSNDIYSPTETLHALEKFNVATGVVTREEMEPYNYRLSTSFMELNADNSILLTGLTDLCNYGQDDLLWANIADSSNSITGKVYIDADNNNIYNPGTDYLFIQGVVKTEKDNSTAYYLDENSHYIFFTDTGSYKTSFNAYNDYFTATPASKLTTYTTFGNTDTVDFALHPKGNINDLSVNMVNTWVTVPSLPNTYEVVYNNEGTTVMNNAVVSVILDSRLIYNSAVPSPASTVGDTLKWNISTLNPSQQGKIKINFTGNTPPFLNGEDSLLSYANIRPVSADSTPLNNDYTLTDIAHYSYDPNDKNVESNSQLIPAQILNGDYITYRVRFQNTGSYSATNVIIKDTLENNLDWNSLQIVSSSHAGLQTSVLNNNIVEFRFNNINLPASSVNEALSHGYVVFKIKPKSTLLPGNTIKNTAHITFDFNVPVKTNTATVRVINVTGTINKNNTEGNISVFPNPNSGNFTIDFTSKGNFQIRLKIYDVTGKEILNETKSHHDQTELQLNEIDLSAGYYNVVISTGKESWSKKIIVTK